jgi:hypothetical protein
MQGTVYVTVMMASVYGTVMQGTCREHAGNMQGHAGDIQGTFRENSGNISGIIREQSGNNKGTSGLTSSKLPCLLAALNSRFRSCWGWHNSGDIQGPFSEHAGDISGNI